MVGCEEGEEDEGGGVGGIGGVEIVEKGCEAADAGAVFVGADDGKKEDDVVR